jgi:protease IV
MSQSNGQPPFPQNQGPNQNDGTGFPPPPPPPPAPGYYPHYGPPPAAERKSVLGWAGRALGGLLVSVLMISIVMNLYAFAFIFAQMQGNTVQTTYKEGKPEQKIVILPVKGAIDDDTAGFMISAIRDFKEDKPKAVILRIDSPGGAVSPSDRIYHELKKFKTENPTVPIIASYGSMSASGGYYISANADEIFAEPTCITGSIGVIAQAFTVQDLMAKIGVTPEIVVATKADKKDTLSPFRAWTESDRNILRGILDNTHNRFIDIVFEGRKAHLTREQVEKLATGAVFTTPQAIGNKLIDAEGYLEDAIEAAKKKANLSDPKVVLVHPAHRGGFLSLITGSAPAVPEKISGEQIRKVMSELSVPRMEFTLQQ